MVLYHTGQLFTPDRSVPRFSLEFAFPWCFCSNLCKGLHICNDLIECVCCCSCNRIAIFRFPLRSYRSISCIYSRFCTVCCQLADLIGHYRKAFSCFSCSGSFNEAFRDNRLVRDAISSIFVIILPILWRFL